MLGLSVVFLRVIWIRPALSMSNSIPLLLHHSWIAPNSRWRGATLSTGIRPVTLMIPSSAYPLRCAPLLYSGAIKSIYSIDDIGEPWGRESLSGRTSPDWPSRVRLAFRPSRKDCTHRQTLVGQPWSISLLTILVGLLTASNTLFTSNVARVSLSCSVVSLLSRLLSSGLDPWLSVWEWHRRSCGGLCPFRLLRRLVSWLLLFRGPFSVWVVGRSGDRTLDSIWVSFRVWGPCTGLLF